MPRSPGGVRATFKFLAISVSLPTLVYTGAVALNGFAQPTWMEDFGFSQNTSVREKAGLRTIACIATLGLWKLWDGVYGCIGTQLAPIGVGEKPQLVKTGPYGYVRHPTYSLVLVQELLFSVMFWSWIPLAACGVIAIAFAVKIPVEEQKLLEDPRIGPAFKEYKSQVTSRILPGVW
ncbi:hypothetical protein JAAARDRAFT_54266 [Jaapia argillacea MUCL 33604]|uniref:Protein-S-isoprenylcysteine O-methyltransferase n=1 Tax=Jaapia argillacea MUCL 33604 TaxID=933084 RepID=A0A067Q5G3_9AGAM|nr:hypothetical protein JAAARDRAFT_54266 [Jaapia argillacea MUCL 33604]